MGDTSREYVERLLDGVTDDWELDAASGCVLYRGGLMCEVYSEDADARFIAAARNLVPALLARAEAAEARADAAEGYRDAAALAREAAAIAIAERDAERETVARLTEALWKALEGLNWAKAHLSSRGVESVAVNEADAAVYAALTQKDQRDWRSGTTKTEDGYNG